MSVLDELERLVDDDAPGFSVMMSRKNAKALLRLARAAAIFFSDEVDDMEMLSVASDAAQQALSDLGRGGVAVKRITKNAVRVALRGMGGWTFSCSTSAVPWHRNPVLRIGSFEANDARSMQRLSNALRDAGFEIVRFDKRERGFYSRLVLGIAGQEEQ